MSGESDPDEPPPPPPSVEVSPELTEAAVEAPPAESLPYPSPPTMPAPMESRPYPSPPMMPAPADDSILPPAADLQDAVGAPTRRRRPEPEPEPDDIAPTSSRRTMAIAGASLFVGIGIVVLIFLGRANAERYLITCSTDRITPEQGRSFPPWGSHPLAGPEWKPVALPANAECTPHEVDSEGALGKLYLDVLVDHTSTALTGKNLLDAATKTGPAPLDAIADELNQALLLARAPERRDQRKEVERLQGDVEYWRATARLRDANAALVDAAKQFETAAAARPRHATDAGEWAGFLRKLTDELHAGPGGTPETPAEPGAAAPAPATTAPPGTALPVEPEGSASAPPAPIDAGVPSGGVLL